MSTCTCLSKGGLTVINLLFFGIGGGLIFLGSFMFREYARFGSAAIQSLGVALLPALLVVVVGMLAVLFASIGCCATFKRNKCLKGMYFFMLLIMLLALITGAVLGFVYRNTLDNELPENLKKMLEEYKDSAAIRGNVDLIQSEFECCGVNKSSDWLETTWYKSQQHTKFPYPDSCCEAQRCTYFAPDTNVFNRGCYTLVVDNLKSHMSIIAGVAGGFGAMLLIGMVLVCVLMCQRRRKRSMEVPYDRMREPYMVGTYTPNEGTRSAPPPYSFS